MGQAKTEQKKCMYCGKAVEKTKYVLRAGKNEEHDIYCCDIECYQAMKRYIEDASKKRNLLYLIAGVLVMFNLVIFGYKLNFRFMYLPMMGLGAILAVNPSLYMTNWFFERLGVKKTVKNIRIVGIGIVLLGAAFTIFWKA